jgi:protocatechuate 3,4-dioxygenase beta subunit
MSPKPEDHTSSPRPTNQATAVSRRALLTGISGTGLIAAGAAATASAATADSPAKTSPINSLTSSPADNPATALAADPRPATPSCTLAREVTEGPYYLDLLTVRRDITEGRPGVPLILRTTVVDSATCQPLANAAVDVWHCDAIGQYSAFTTPAERTYLRGVQLTDPAGVAEFRSIYPGWYSGRAVHIHLKVHVGGRVTGGAYVGGHVSHTGQLYFDDAVSDQVMRLAPYSAHTGWRLPNLLDLIFWQGAGSGLLTLQRINPATLADGFVGSAVLGVDPAS